MPTQGSLTVLESETGSGKTEAAVAHYYQLCTAGLVDAVYFALPTRTSAAQLHGRIEQAVTKMFVVPPPVTLAVPGYLDNSSKSNGIHPHASVGNEDAENWTSQNTNRYLAAAIAVGTIDQLLLSITPAKHAMMRWASLGRTLIIVDEVHSSDVFMSHILEVLVKRHIRRGGHVLLMSATLGSHSLQRYVAAAGANLSTHIEGTDLPYPVAHSVSDGTYKFAGLPHTGRIKTVSLDVSDSIDDDEAVADLAIYHAKRGAKVLVVRNTVNRCVGVHEAIFRKEGKDFLLRTKDGIDIPHHGRFVASDRFIVDHAISTSFGKLSGPGPLIAVGTQTVEQSLDIDADLVITDLCPIDVLLQRLGRLHRHATKARPADYHEARAIILAPQHSLKDYVVKPGNGFGIERAYENVLTTIATYKIIKKYGRITIPEMNRLLVEKGTNPGSLEQLAEGDELLVKHFRDVLGKSGAHRTIAMQNVRSDRWRYGDAFVDAWGRGNSRLGEFGTRLSLPNSIRTPLGGLMDELIIPAWMMKNTEKSIDVKAEDILYLSSGLLIKAPGKEFHYGPHGLELMDARLKRTK